MIPFSRKKLSAEERRFVGLWVESFNKLNSEVGYRVAPFTLLAYIALLATLGNAVTQRFIPLYAAWSAIMLLTWPFRLHHVAKFALTTVCFYITITVTALNMVELRQPDLVEVLSRQRVTLCVAIILLAILASHRQVLNAVVAASLIGIFAVINRGQPGVVTDVVTLWVCVTASTAILYFVGHHQCQVALRELTIRQKMAPRHIVAGSGTDLASMERAFSPKPRTGVYVSSDWRGYQQLSDSVDMERLSHALSEYYDVCEQVLSQAFTAGNFYFDWIADELFIVFFETDAMPIAEVCRKSLETCVELMKAKHRFYKKFGFPHSIDIGVSTGEAFVGMMGPKSFQKATALGKVPGRARRMQSLGKALRQAAGDYDRLIFGEEVRAYLAADVAVAERELDASEHARDLTDRKIYFMLPRYAESASPTTRYYEPSKKPEAA